MDDAVLMLRDDIAGEYPVVRWQGGQESDAMDWVAEEVPVALVYNGISHAVMLATPQHLEDFALGFSLSEGILETPSELYGVEIVQQAKGIEVHLEIAAERFHALKQRRRNLAGRTGCGLCGAESLEQAMRIPGNVVRMSERIHSRAIQAAHQQISSLQQLQALTGATHACAWASQDGVLDLLREDVGRHNALDKLIGAYVGAGSTNTAGFVLTTSRASYEMVQKVASVGLNMLVAISAPTGLAIRIAQRCGVTLVGFARGQQCVIYSHPERILGKEAA